MMSPDLSPNACFANFLSLFRKWLNVSTERSQHIRTNLYLANSFRSSFTFSLLKYRKTGAIDVWVVIFIDCQNSMASTRSRLWK